MYIYKSQWPTVVIQGKKSSSVAPSEGRLQSNK